MYPKIDWYSFSLTWHTLPKRAGDTTVSVILSRLNDISPDMAIYLDTHGDWVRGKGRKPYSDSLRHIASGITCYYHPSLTHCVFEISGQGCDYLFNAGNMFAVMNLTAHRATRIDLACDFETTVTPAEFCEQREQGRFKASSHIDEQSGSTRYIGSRSSNRFARVYRYNEPHPRSHLLRVEYQLMAEDAKRTAQALLQNGLEPVIKTLGEQFGWKHPLWDMGAYSEAPLTAYRAERGQGKTLFWLYNTVAPLLKRLHLEGELDLEQFLADVLDGQSDDVPHVHDADFWQKLDNGEIPF